MHLCIFKYHIHPYELLNCFRPNYLSVLDQITILLSNIYAFRCCDGRLNNSRNLHTHRITELLDSLLRGYDKHLRPGFGGKRSYYLIYFFFFLYSNVLFHKWTVLSKSVRRVVFIILLLITQ